MASLAVGLSLEKACEAASVHHRALLKHLESGTLEAQVLEAEISKQKAALERLCATQVMKAAAEGDVDTAKWVLTNRYTKRWSGAAKKKKEEAKIEQKPEEVKKEGMKIVYNVPKVADEQPAAIAETQQDGAG